MDHLLDASSLVDVVNDGKALTGNLTTSTIPK
jgi:hypothetical protein